jgi:hypothetical protein
VLVVRGTPEQIGEQKAHLLGEAARRLRHYPKRLVAAAGDEDGWPRAVELAERLARQFPEHHRRELDALARASGEDRELGLVANTMTDTYRSMFQCSSLIVETNRSATGGPLFGRNLDFFGMGVLHRYSLVTVVCGESRHAFASVGFPGIIGVISGINDAGLAVAVHEVHFTADDAPKLNPDGEPYTLLFRRVLEECTTVAEAEKLLRAAARTTLLNLAACDQQTGAVFELTPKTVHVRKADDGVIACTNHFRTPGLARWQVCLRYPQLVLAGQKESLAVNDVAEALHKVNLGPLTLQSMVFEPKALKLNLSIGDPPASAHPLRALELKALFGEREKARESEAE